MQNNPYPVPPAPYPALCDLLTYVLSVPKYIALTVTCACRRAIHSLFAWSLGILTFPHQGRAEPDLRSPAHELFLFGYLLPPLDHTSRE